MYFATPFVFNAATEGFPWDYLRKVLHGNQTLAAADRGEEINIVDSFNPLSKVHARTLYRQTADRQTDSRSKYRNVT